MDESKLTIGEPASEAGTVADLVRQAVQAEAQERPIQRTAEGGAPFMVLPDGCGGMQVHPLGEYEPPRKKAQVMFAEQASFIDYFTLYADTHSRLWCDVEKRSFLAVLDYHDEATGDAVGRRGEHRAMFTLRYTPAMQAWLNLARGPIPQAALAEFLEDRYRDIEEPAGAEVLELARTLEVKNNVAFRSSQRRNDGGYDLAYEEQVSTKAGRQGTMEVPDKFLLALPAFEGGDLVGLPVRLRFRLAEGAVIFGLTFVGLEDLLREEVGRVRHAIERGTERTVWAGTVAMG